MKTNLELVDDCNKYVDLTPPYHSRKALTSQNSFPYELTKAPQEQKNMVKNLYELITASHDYPIGFIRPYILENMPWSPKITINHQRQEVRLPEDDDEATLALSETLNKARATDRFAVLRGWRNELYPVTGLKSNITVERAGSALFGIVTYGVHMTAYTEGPNGIMIWVPRRSSTKSTYPSMLDNTVAGGITAGEEPFESLVREAAEEASLPEEIVRNGAKPCGTVSYFHVRDSKAGGETGLMQPEMQFVYDLKLPEDTVLKPSDDEVQEFYLWGIEEVQNALAEEKFKPNCALVLLDFFVRHSILTVENEPDYMDIVAKLHRKLPYPSKPRQDDY
ncbi:hypothetical protein MMC17_001607 [Xylographa soralifera]|nr:hypothetical protein [Xylographa soralifera]